MPGILPLIIIIILSSPSSSPESSLLSLTLIRSSILLRSSFAYFISVPAVDRRALT